MSFVEQKDFAHKVREDEIHRRLGLYVTSGILEEKDLDVLMRAEKERFGSLEGCGCLSCTLKMMKKANAVIEKCIKDENLRDRLGFYIEEKYNVRPRLLIYEEFIGLEEYYHDNPNPISVLNGFEDDILSTE